MWKPFSSGQTARLQDGFVARTIVLVEGRHSRTTMIQHPKAGPPIKLKDMLTGREYFQTGFRDERGRLIYRLKEA